MISPQGKKMDWNLNLRAVERLLITLSGTLCIYLGYLLFVKGVSGKASLRLDYDKSKLQLANAAPGIFFALFGVAVLVFTMWKSVTVDYLVPLGTKQAPEASVSGPQPRLPFSNEEAKELETFLRKNNFGVTVVAPPGLDAPKLQDKIKTGDYVILHFSTHGFLADEPRTSPENGKQSQEQKHP